MSDTHAKSVAVVDHKAPPAITHPVVQGLIDRGDLSTEALDRLMGLQERHERREAEKAFNMALVALKRDLPAVIGHDASVSYKNTNYTHSTLAYAMDQVQPALTRHGFALYWRTPDAGKGLVSVTCVLAHEMGHSSETTLSGQPDTSGSKNAVQAVASTVTYLKRYTALSLLGISTADMKDVDQNRNEPRGDGVDQNQTVKAVSELRRMGALDDAKSYLGKEPQAWTLNDIQNLREWVRTRAKNEPPPAPAVTEDGTVNEPPPLTEEEQKQLLEAVLHG